jgi:adenylate cyclase
MFTDIVGYTSLTQSDESLALDVLEKHNRILRPIFQKYFGKEVKTMGDSFLIEFDSALHATRCAIEIQRYLHDYNSDDQFRKEEKSQSLPSQKINLRIGIHVGDIIHREGDVFGDAVNIASRIEPLAKTGGICLSQQVYDHLGNKVQDVSIVSLGKHVLKNVELPLNVYRVVLPWETDSTAVSDSGKTESVLSNRNRLAVLPLVSMSSCVEDEFFSDGLTEELISTISHIQQIGVISRTSIMRYKKAQNKSLSEIGAELGAAYVLEGSIRKYGRKLRVTAQLIDVRTDEHVWAQNYDRELEDVFSIQSDIASSIAEALKVHLLEKEKQLIDKNPTGSVEAHDLYLKGRYYMNKRTEESLLRAKDFFNKAIERDPNYALAYVGIADSLLLLVEHGFARPKEAVAEARNLATRALELDDTLAEAHVSLAAGLETSFLRAAAEREFKRAIELNPNYALAHHWYAVYLLGEWRLDEVISEMKKALELDPLSMQIRTILGASHYYMSNFDRAEKILLDTIEFDSNFGLAHLFLSLVYVEKGLFDDAITEATTALKLQPGSPVKCNLGYVYGRAGRKDNATRILNEVLKESEQHFVPYDQIALIYTGLGLYDQALDWLERAFDEQSSLFLHNLRANWFSPLRPAKRFRDLETKVRKNIS